MIEEITKRFEQLIVNQRKYNRNYQKITKLVPKPPVIQKLSWFSVHFSLADVRQQTNELSHDLALVRETSSCNVEALMMERLTDDLLLVRHCKKLTDRPLLR